MSTRVRQRAILRQNRMLIRMEKMTQRDVVRELRRLARRMGRDWASGGEPVVLGHVDVFQSALTVILRRRLTAAALAFGYEMLRSLGVVVKGAVEIFEESVSRWISTYALSRAKTVADTLKKGVSSILQSAFEEGLGEQETARMLREKIGSEQSISNAARIARTEAHTAASIGSDQAARSTGLDMEKEWASTEDARTRLTHAMADGQRRSMEELFDIGLAKLMYPGDPAGPAGEVINCRCVVLYHPIIAGRAV